MIGRLRGAVAEVSEEDALIDVMGVGYVVRCGSRTLSRLPEIGGEALLHVESHFGEQTGLTLYGFLSRDDRQAFVLLRTIQGVGPKAALAVLDVLPPGELAGAVARSDTAAVARASGVGPKLALRFEGNESFDEDEPDATVEAVPVRRGRRRAAGPGRRRAGRPPRG